MRNRGVVRLNNRIVKIYSTDCLICGDIDRSVEVIQNIMENAIKYGDGKSISINLSEEEGCILVSVSNSGCTLPDADLPHVFESFRRGKMQKPRRAAVWDYTSVVSLCVK